jgi:hypothetical protein
MRSRTYCEQGCPIDVQVFFGIGREVDTSNLAWNLAFIGERCPNHQVLPIACDSGGNLFCLEIKDGIAAKVVYCDLDGPECVFYKVASSFESFLKSLRPFE